MDVLKKIWNQLDSWAGAPTPQARKANLERLAFICVLLDSKFGLPFDVPIIGKYRFGIMPFVNLVPFGGPLLGGAISLYLLYLSLKFDVGKFTLFRMFFWPVISTGVSFIPFFGSILGSGFQLVMRPSTANLRLLSDHLEKADVEVLQKAEVAQAGQLVSAGVRKAPPPPPR